MNEFTVLCVDDNDNVLQLFILLFDGIVGKVVVARDGAEGWRLFNINKPDLVVTDICMPVMDGLGMAALIKERDPSIPILFVTSSPERVSKFDRFDPHIDHVCDKSVDYDKFAEILKRYVNSKAVRASQSYFPTHP